MAEWVWTSDETDAVKWLMKADRYNGAGRDGLTLSKPIAFCQVKSACFSPYPEAQDYGISVGVMWLRSQIISWEQR